MGEAEENYHYSWKKTKEIVCHCPNPKIDLLNMPPLT
jgi:hypothetical protein